MEIPPKFAINSKVTDLIALIDSNRLFINSKNIPPIVQQNIDRVSLLKSALYSAKIEGNELQEHNFNFYPKDQKKLEVLNIQKAINYINSEITGTKPVILETILTLQKISMENIVPNAGKIRSDNLAIFNSAGVAVYFAPPPSELSIFLEKLINYINSSSAESPIIVALIAHLILEKIHPFQDGNGRVGRLLIYAVLKAKSYNFGVPVVLEEEINKRRDEYYYHLDQGYKNVEDYLFFMLEIFYNQTETVKTQLTYIPQENDVVLSLAPRQGEIYNIIKDHQLVSLDFIHRRFVTVPARTLRYDLKKLQEKGLINKTSSTRGAFYRVV
ncbi:MAG: Fic family protein [Patescibacteria group bacterium]